MVSKSIIACLNKGEKLDCDNYDIWNRKIQHILDDQEILETLTQEMTAPEDGNTLNIVSIEKPIRVGLRKIVVRALGC